MTETTDRLTECRDPVLRVVPAPADINSNGHIFGGWVLSQMDIAGGIVASGVCFYQSYAREMAEANGWQRLLTNSAKLVNIIAGYGYKPTLGTMEDCVRSAVAGRIC